MFIKGRVFLHPQLEYKDGSTGKKLMVLLDTPADGSTGVFVLTTSQLWDRPTEKGCHKPHKCFCIPKKDSSFKLDTWICLDDYYLLDGKIAVESDGLRKLFDMDVELVDEIINCFKSISGDDISEEVLERLSKPQKVNLEGLFDKYNKR